MGKVDAGHESIAGASRRVRLFEEWCRNNPYTARDIGANAALSLLVKMQRELKRLRRLEQSPSNDPVVVADEGR